ncbi:conserved Plasmodium protein, unknown function [Plasmodium yoelii]|uniref:Uncharacterized protein n=4 Tax=Plasmodium yoelii TaxID=5861 RepID=Q7RGR8_PLAYO|nr:conserved Plasmodium protein, unknown function [Plasmodium yoelii]EAA16113.1 hypothetical protein [Plasmodium yoelii yoelii]CDU17699.1 conserved Plasmodium protein, unknown function, fragment [Plasmodium yoelii]VTZ77678.1 conserved Plasmodium protein, unknown function [Plasmodium yoelii]|eukprot:XP_724548.1 conserved Plasmodium protein, unknown function [Plasmodium yoelii]
MIKMKIIKLVFMLIPFIYYWGGSYAYITNKGNVGSIMNYNYKNAFNEKKELLNKFIKKAKRQYLNSNINISNIGPGFKKIFDSNFLFGSSWKSHKDLIIRKLKGLRTTKSNNTVKNVAIIVASCITVITVMQSMIMLRNFFHNQYKDISKQEEMLLGRSESPHIEI